MTRKKRTYLISISVVMLLWGAFSWLMCTLSFGFYLEANKAGLISMCQTYADQQTTKTTSQSTERGYVSFMVGPQATHFNFHFSPIGTPYQIKAMALWGIPLFNATWIWEKINPSEPLYKQVASLSKGECLPFYITEEIQTVDYIRFFDSLLRIFKVVRLLGSIAFASLIVILIFCLLKGEAVSEFTNKIQTSQKLFALLNKNPLFFTLLGIVLLLSLPPPVLPVETGTDPSWISLLNHLSFRKMFGSSAVFTYGPLGFILVPQAMGANVIIALISNLFQLIILGGVYIFLFNQGQTSRMSTWCLLACHLIPTRIPEWQWTILPLILIATVSLNKSLSKRTAVSLTFLSAGLCVFVSLMKFSSCLLILSTSFMAITYLFLRDPKKTIYLATVYVGTFLFFCILACVTLFASFAAFSDWMKYSFQLATGYNLYMLVNKSWAELMLPFLYLFIILWMLLWRVQDFWRNLARFCIFAPLFFLLIKYAITRQHIDPLLYVGPIVSGLWLLDADAGWRKRLMGLITCQFLIAFLFTWFFIFAGSTTAPFVGLSFGNLKNTLMLTKTIEQSRQKSTLNLASARLPDDWLAVIGTNRVQSIPLEYSYLLATPLDATPFYTFQGYGCFLHTLGAKSAELYFKKDAPCFIICELFALDGRNMFLDMPCVWKGIQENYKLIKHTDKLALLEKAQTMNVNAKLSNKIVIQKGEWLDTSLLKGRQIAIQWPQTIIGKFLSFLLRNDMTFLTIEYADGAIRKYRVLPDTLQGTFNLDRIPRNFEDVISVLSETPDSGMRAQRIRFDSNYGFYYPKEITIQH